MDPAVSARSRRRVGPQDTACPAAEPASARIRGHRRTSLQSTQFIGNLQPGEFADLQTMVRGNSESARSMGTQTRSLIRLPCRRPARSTRTRAGRLGPVSCRRAARALGALPEGDHWHPELFGEQLECSQDSDTSCCRDSTRLPLVISCRQSMTTFLSPPRCFRRRHFARIVSGGSRRRLAVRRRKGRVAPMRRSGRRRAGGSSIGCS